MSRRMVAVRFAVLLDGAAEVLVGEDETIEAAVTRKLREADLDLAKPLAVVIRVVVDTTRDRKPLGRANG